MKKKVKPSPVSGYKKQIISLQSQLDIEYQKRRIAEAAKEKTERDLLFKDNRTIDSLHREIDSLRRELDSYKGNQLISELVHDYRKRNGELDLECAHLREELERIKRAVAT